MSEDVFVNFDKVQDAYVLERVANLDLAIYTYDQIYHWLQCQLHPKDKYDHQQLLELAQRFWERSGRGDTRLEDVSITLWALKA